MNADGTTPIRPRPGPESEGGVPGIEGLAPAAVARLISVVQELSHVRDLPALMAIVRKAARELTGADGASFVLRDGDLCYYADEDAIEPLWKGKRFPMSACISGWVMHHRKPVALLDIYADPRIPADAYRPTFVKSLAMVPIRASAPIGAIGNYWAAPHQPTAAELSLLQALADSTSIALENLQLFIDLERRVADRTAELQAANRDLEAFSYSVSHDLRTPLQAVGGFCKLLAAHAGDGLDGTGRAFLDRIAGAAERMGLLIDDMLTLSSVSHTEVRRETLRLDDLARDVLAELQSAEPHRQVHVAVEPGPPVQGDGRLLRIALANLLANAWKYTARQPEPRIAFRPFRTPAGEAAFLVEDNGAGFDMVMADHLFQPFHRLHDEAEFSGTGVGLATVQRVISRHGGRIWAEAEPGRGARFCFTLPQEASA